MAFEIPSLSADVSTQQDCVRILTNSNGILDQSWKALRHLWPDLWDKDLTVVEMQSRIDYLASVPATDPSGAKDAFTAICAKALRLIQWILIEDSTAFDDAELESTGARQPNGQPYKKYLTPGWLYVIDGTKPSGIAVISPCIWNS